MQLPPPLQPPLAAPPSPYSLPPPHSLLLPSQPPLAASPLPFSLPPPLQSSPSSSASPSPHSLPPSQSPFVAASWLRLVSLPSIFFSITPTPFFFGSSGVHSNRFCSFHPAYLGTLGLSGLPACLNHEFSGVIFPDTNILLLQTFPVSLCPWEQILYLHFAPNDSFLLCAPPSQDIKVTDTQGCFLPLASLLSPEAPSLAPPSLMSLFLLLLIHSLPGNLSHSFNLQGGSWPRKPCLSPGIGWSPFPPL